MYRDVSELQKIWKILNLRVQFGKIVLKSMKSRALNIIER